MSQSHMPVDIAVGGRVSTQPGERGLPKVVVVADDGAQLEAYLHGGHVTAWRPAGREDDVLFLSRASQFRDGAAIRGGVPVIFPQFELEGPLPRHGLVRNRAWELVAAGRTTAGAAAAVFACTDTPASRAIWPHGFRLTLAAVAAGSRLDLSLSVTNTGPTPFTFTGALHTYLRIKEIGDTEVAGLHDVTYIDKVNGGARAHEGTAALRIAGEIDRTYLDVPGPVRVVEAARTLEVAQNGFADVVVWNPGPGKGAALSDLEPDGWRHMLCIEAAAVGRPIVVEPGGTWQGTQTLNDRGTCAPQRQPEVRRE